MADVFLSYAREDAARAEQVAKGLQAAGLDVFWDNEIPPGTTWADYIESKLTQCKALIVLWSEHSTKSQWVREEARMGRDKGCLIPVMIDNSQAPFGFGEVQAANLANWNGQADHPNWRRFVDAVMNITKTTPRPAAQPAPSAPPRAAAAPTSSWSAPIAATKQGVPVWVWVVAAVIGTIVVLGIIGSMMPQQQQVATTAPPQMQQPVLNQPQTPAGDQNPQQIIVAQLQQAQAALGQQGYQMVGQPYSGGLQPGEAWNIPAEMHVGYEYQIVGVCDRDCADLDLRLFDGNGGLIIEDTSVNSQPNVGVLPTSSGAFTIQVHMYNCTVAPCYYAVAMYARPRQ
ncbi:MAG: toll/interleukin-1 receptor domain-containing protein [Caulobacteraceae bacterium]